MVKLLTRLMMTIIFLVLSFFVNSCNSSTSGSASINGTYTAHSSALYGSDITLKISGDIWTSTVSNMNGTHNYSGYIRGNELMVSVDNQFGTDTWDRQVGTISNGEVYYLNQKMKK